MDEIEAELFLFDVTCHTPGCENGEVTIRVYALPGNPTVMCGPCSRLIEDVISVEP